MHITVDREAQAITNISLTESNVHDSIETKNLLSEISNISSVTGDIGPSHSLRTAFFRSGLASFQQFNEN